MADDHPEGVARSSGVDLSTTFDLLTDCVAVLDDAGNVVDANPFLLQLLAYDRDQVLGHSMAEFIHPDDLERAIRVMSMVSTDSLAVPITPALYRIRRRDGSYLPIELNGAAVPRPASTPPVGAEDTPWSVVVGRYSADRDLQDQMMSRLTRGESPTALIELVPGFGRWRHQLDHYAVIYRDEHGQRAVAGSDVAVALARLDLPDTPWDRAAADHRAAQVSVEDMTPQLAAAAAERGLRACWVQAVDDPAHEEAAVILVWERVGGSHLDVHEYALQTMASALAVILQWRHQVTSLVQAARHDPLTGLANRTGFWEVLDALARDASGALVAVLYVDLDGFKEVNDRHGHRTGDLILTEAAQRIASVVRPGDSVARLGGDEFAIVCRDLDRDEEAVAIAERVLAVVTQPLSVDDGLVDDGLVEVGASVGIATVPGRDLRPDELLDAADRALYGAKRSGRGRWQLTSVAGPDDTAGTLG